MEAFPGLRIWVFRGCQAELANEARPFWVEAPSGNEVVHGGGVIARTLAELAIQFVGMGDAIHIQVNAQAGAIGNNDGAVLDSQRLARKPLSVLPDPVSVDRRDWAEC